MDYENEFPEEETDLTGFETDEEECWKQLEEASDRAEDAKAAIEDMVRLKKVEWMKAKAAAESKKPDIMREAAALEPAIIELRRYFHRHPEQSWHEVNTQKKICEVLSGLGIPYITAVKTGVVATIKGGKSDGRILGIRADIDALPVTEQTGCEFASENPGTMHACGHDTHAAILLGTAMLLKKLQPELPVDVRLVFQPAEEFISDSGGGYMKDVPEVRECDRMIGLHIWSQVEAGYASLREGPVLASADTFEIEITGKGGHGAMPHTAIDPIPAGVMMIEEMQRVLAREISPLVPAVMGVTSFQAGTSNNVIPSNAHLRGTCRTFDSAVRDRFPEILRRIARGVAESTGTEITVDYLYGPPVTVNDPACVATARKAAVKVFGADRVIATEPKMIGEDFSKYQCPKCFLGLGGGPHDPEQRFAQHSPYFQIDESVLKLGTAYFVNYVLEYGAEK